MTVLKISKLQGFEKKKRQLFESMMFFVAKVGERHHAKN